jgi:hypothetical protein
LRYDESANARLRDADEAAQGIAIVHIGTHRTGTTSFQRWAFTNRDELARGTGLEYYNGLFGPNHYEIPMLCLRANRSMPMRAITPDWCLDEWQQRAAAHIREDASRGPRPLLISAEGMSYVRHPDEVARLVDLLHPRRVSVVGVLRERASFLRSYGRALADAGFPPSPYRESFAYVEEDSWLVNYDALLGVYREVLGTDRVAAVGYERAIECHGSIIPAILAACGFHESQLPPWNGFRDNTTRPHRSWFAAVRRLVSRGIR